MRGSGRHLTKEHCGEAGAAHPECAPVPLLCQGLNEAILSHAVFSPAGMDLGLCSVEPEHELSPRVAVSTVRSSLRKQRGQHVMRRRKISHARVKGKGRWGRCASQEVNFGGLGQGTAGHAWGSLHRHREVWSTAWLWGVWYLSPERVTADTSATIGCVSCGIHRIQVIKPSSPGIAPVHLVLAKVAV